MTETYTAFVGQGHKIELVLPDIPEGAAVSVTVDYARPQEAGFRRQPGSAAGQVWIAPNFEDPLEEFDSKKYRPHGE